MTSNLRKRVWEHKNHIREGFTDDYNCTRLVYWESFDDVLNAINREKQLKRWRREKKDWLIQRKNPRWKDLAANWYPAETPLPDSGSPRPLSSRAEENDSKNRSLESRDLASAFSNKREL